MFRNVAGCEAYRGHLSAGNDFTGVTECEPTPTSWLGTGGDASPF